MQAFILIYHRNAAKVKLYIEGAILTKKGVPVLCGEKEQPIDCLCLCLSLPIAVLLLLLHTTMLVPLLLYPHFFQMPVPLHT